MKTETIALARHCEVLSLKKWAKNRKKHLHYRPATVKFDNYEAAGRLFILGGNSSALLGADGLNVGARVHGNPGAN